MTASPSAPIPVRLAQTFRMRSGVQSLTGLVRPSTMTKSLPEADILYTTVPLIVSLESFET